MQDLIAIIPARGGSKGLPGKNIALLAGKPLIAHTILAAKAVDAIDWIVVSTDCPEIAEVARSFDVDVIIRPSELAQDSSSSASAVFHVLEYLEKQGKYFANLILLQPTSPLRTQEHISDAIELYNSGDGKASNSVISVCACKHHPYKSLLYAGRKLKPLISEQVLSMPRQKLPKAVNQNGAIYLVSVDNFKRTYDFYVDPCLAFEMTAEDSVDIDTIDDLQQAENILQR